MLKKTLLFIVFISIFNINNIVIAQPIDSKKELTEVKKSLVISDLFSKGLEYTIKKYGISKVREEEKIFLKTLEKEKIICFERI